MNDEHIKEYVGDDSVARTMMTGCKRQDIMTQVISWWWSIYIHKLGRE